MKKILASLLTAYVLTNGQAPPVDVAAQAQQTTTAPVAPAVVTNAPGTTTTAAQASQAPQAPQTTASAAATTRLATTQARVAATTTTSAPVIVTSAPVVITPPVPVVPERVTPTPTTPAPTLNPYCPYNAGQQSGIQPDMFNENKVCFTANELATDYLGRLRCDNFACCQCAQINCGFDGYPCEQLQIGDNGAIGVQKINVRGAPEINNSPLQNMFGGNVFNHHGAKIECQGRKSCQSSVIRGEMVRECSCSGDFGCQGAKIILNDPAPGISTLMQCNGLSSCEGFDLEINVGVAEALARAPGQECNPNAFHSITELGKIEFNGQFAGSNAVVNIDNRGCGTLLFDAFECMSLESCPGIVVNVKGNVAIRHCDLMGVAPGNPAIQSLVAACQSGQNYQNYQPNTFPQIPIIPSNPFNPNPNPVNPTPVNPINPINPSPVFPAPGQGFPNFGQVDPRSSSMQCDMVGMPFVGPGITNPRACTDQTITLQIANNFVLDCSLAGACDRMTLTLNAGYDPTRNPIVQTTRIDSLKFIQPTSDVTIYINNEFGLNGQSLRINDIRCDGPNTCRNLKIIAGPGVDIMSTNYDCGDIMSCIGATVTQGTTTMPIDPRTANLAGLPGFVNQQPQAPPAGVPPNPSNPGPQMPFNPWV